MPNPRESRLSVVAAYPPPSKKSAALHKYHAAWCGAVPIERRDGLVAPAPAPSACRIARLRPFIGSQQYLLLRRNLVYTGVTRGKKLVTFIGQRKALAIAVRNNKTEQRFSGLLASLVERTNARWQLVQALCARCRR